MLSMVGFSLNTPLLDWWESADIDVSMMNAKGETLLACSRSVRLSERLLKRGADVNQLYSLKNAFLPDHHVLVNAAKNFGLEMVKLLVKAGADVNTIFPAQYCVNPLNAALYRGDFDLVKYLVEEANADVFVDLPKTSILFEAAVKCPVQIVRYLVNKVKSNAERPVDQLLVHALSGAAFIGDLDTVKYFVEEVKVDPDMPLQEGIYGSTLASAHTLTVVKYLVEHARVDVNARLQHGDYGSALASHAAYGHLSIVKYLVEEAHADINMPLELHKHHNALEAAKASGIFGEEVVQYLESRLSGRLVEQFENTSSSKPLDHLKGSNGQKHSERSAGRQDRKFSTATGDFPKKLVSTRTF